jgi:predicted dehydrogenase
MYLSKPIKIGIVGAGFIARRHVKCYKLVNAEPVAVAAMHEGTAKEFAREYGLKAWYTDYKKMLKRPDIDLISICVPNYLHSDVAITAAEEGKDIVCEKPLAISLEQADKMIDMAKRYGVKLMYAENIIYSPAIKRANELIGEGAIGRILTINTREIGSLSHSSYALKKEYCGGGVLIHLACHGIGLIMWLIRKPIKRVYAEMGNLYHNIEVEDHVTLLMRFKDNELGSVHANYFTRGGLDARTEIIGTEGLIRIDPCLAIPGLLSVYSKKGYGYALEKAELSIGWTFPTIDELWQFGYIYEIRHFIECCAKDEEPLTTGEFGRNVLKVIFAGYKSAEEEKIVALI